jgi:hypothetical protein
MLQALAIHAIKEWKGIGDANGNICPANSESISELIRDFPLIASKFENQYIREILELDAEGNGSSVAPNGISEAALDTVADVMEIRASPNVHI